MSIDEKKAFHFLFIALVVLVVALAANTLIDLGAVIHDVTHPH